MQSVADVPTPVAGSQHSAGLGCRHNPISRIIVDLTPLLPAGINGGAKPMTLELLNRLISRSPGIRFVLLTLRRTADELMVFNQPNVHRIVVDSAVNEADATLVESISRPAPKPVPGGLRRYTEAIWLKFRSSRFNPRSPARQLRNSVVFCPFTAPFFSEAKIPMVSLIHDLQYLDYPQYFSDQAKTERQRHFADACLLADRLVCVSDFVRRRVLEASRLSPHRVVTIHTRLARRLPAPAPNHRALLQRRFGLDPDCYLLYPANFWKHKNHEMLLVALGLFARRFPDSDLKFVCTGAEDERSHFIRSAAQRMGLQRRVIFPGYVNDVEFSTLMHGCLALIYPSLYEGFGMPVVEAQAIGKPVLCGNVTSLPEVTGGAAVIFDPALPEAIVAAIHRVASDAGFREELSRKGQINALRFADTDAMANEYLFAFADAVRTHRRKA